MAGERIERAAYSVRDLREQYGIGKTKLYEEVAAGRLIARKLGIKTLFLAEDVERWVKSWPICNADAMGDETGEGSRSYENRLLKSLSE